MAEQGSRSSRTAVSEQQPPHVAAVVGGHHVGDPVEVHVDQEELGGGEAFLRQEREEFNRGMERREALSAEAMGLSPDEAASPKEISAIFET